MSARESLHDSLAAALAWQIELGADEAILDAPQDRFATAQGAAGASQAPAALPAAPPSTSNRRAEARPPEQSKAGARPAPSASAPIDGADAEADATAIAATANTLEELAEVMRRFEGSDLRLGAKNLVFSDGTPGARVMVIGEAPGAEEDRVGRPFVGRAGQLLDRMLGAIGLARTAPDPGEAAYITNVLPWRPPGNRTPSSAEAALFMPFLMRHIELAAPDFILALGNTPVQALLATTTGITRMRGRWRRHEASGCLVLPSFHPAYLLRSPERKREAWRDLLALRAALDGAPVAPE
ncbi:uracil-DNA glycosylase [Limibaculum sp. M0105]|uniref:Type-4 uracil-DNA glycosylase n=1 Tax=Thermohalobaculum xanthum TaxID=2753746 RepID=A0A8J7M856_9RHOB|nr:uracil-DNA glycosylase [Thermohalobaculum xanthum]MBK0400354.1 uracil-DNA glycosylase [Thermohalobaculum xanthum]